MKRAGGTEDRRASTAVVWSTEKVGDGTATFT
jgi:hypothetical protein